MLKSLSITKNASLFNTTRGVAKKERQRQRILHSIAVKKAREKFVKLRRSTRLQIKALNKDSPHGHPWAAAFLFGVKRCHHFDNHISY